MSLTEANALRFWPWSRNARGRSQIFGSRALLGMVSLRSLILVAIASIPVLVFLLVVFCVALLILPVVALLAAIPVAVLHVLSARSRRRSATAVEPIDVEYRIVSRDSREGPQDSG